jgi:hypothetical protein
MSEESVNGKRFYVPALVNYGDGNKLWKGRVISDFLTGDRLLFRADNWEGVFCIRRTQLIAPDNTKPSLFKRLLRLSA